MKNLYINLMERAISAYSREHIKRYFAEVKKNGLTEHGFPRLTSNIGILLSHGRCPELKPLFVEMMDFCCTQIPRVKAANDFSVREVVCCIRECERAGCVDSDCIFRWKSGLANINPDTCYNVIATSPESNVKNWALFTGVSEFFRKNYGIGGNDEFIEVQIASQLKWIDENGMYMDAKSDTHHPMVYDLVARGLFVMLLNEGYNGCYREQLDGILKRSALVDLKMQSPNGEIPYGGRSNQFLHNEPWLCTVLEYEANRYAREGNQSLAGKFKSAIKRAISVTEGWLKKEPLYHIKNRFPIETKFGCEGYAYFDKYMITAASNMYAAYSVCDDSIDSVDTADAEPCTFKTSYHFHKIFLKAGGYGIELDTDADSHYDAFGVGRVHKAGAPSTVCLSVPCPEHPAGYVIPEGAEPLSLCPGIISSGKALFALKENSKYELLSLSEDESAAYARLRCAFENKAELLSDFKVDENGVKISVNGKGEIAFLLPAFYFDGESYTEIAFSDNELSVAYNGYACRYATNGKIEKLETISANRNGIYKAFYAKATNTLNIEIEIVKL